MKRFLQSLTLIVSTLLLFVGCAGDRYSTVEGAMLGTTLRIVSDVKCSPRKLYAKAMELDEQIKSEMSIYDPNSLLSRINRGETDSVTPGLNYLLRLSDMVSRHSGGEYDVTVLPLVRAYGFAGEEAEQNPNIDSLLEFVGFYKIKVYGDHLRRMDIRTQIDLNSIAKGYTVDKLAELVESLGAENYIVDIGGEILCKGINAQGTGWRVGVESPIDGNMTNGDYIEKRIMVDPNSELRAMATSGNYRRYYLDENGQKVTHTISPTTGKSKNSSLLSATVVAKNCALADAYSTMFMAVDEKDIMIISQYTPDTEVYFIFADSAGGYREYFSEGMRRMILE